eukprot:TRINITY_DN6772_c4_g1_i1.p2 TRINITY_DN6772_c4_g1~~TRINITY_DN6772_c4_g1_i1.p2  ORF type:complete len:402 (+),score=144.47 TRINITY_DN6772_c4_g1_i1:57-1262(+)
MSGYSPPSYTEGAQGGCMCDACRYRDCYAAGPCPQYPQYRQCANAGYYGSQSPPAYQPSFSVSRSPQYTDSPGPGPAASPSAHAMPAAPPPLVPLYAHGAPSPAASTPVPRPYGHRPFDGETPPPPLLSPSVSVSPPQRMYASPYDHPPPYAPPSLAPFGGMDKVTCSSGGPLQQRPALSAPQDQRPQRRSPLQPAHHVNVPTVRPSKPPPAPQRRPAPQQVPAPQPEADVVGPKPRADFQELAVLQDGSDEDYVFLCPWCDRQFSQQQGVLGHIVHAHADARTCPKCTRVLENVRGLVSHLRAVHMPPAPQALRDAPKTSCAVPGCKWRARTYKSLACHIRAKHPTNPICPKCKIPFATSAECVAHIKDQHPDPRPWLGDSRRGASVTPPGGAPAAVGCC